jgi:hypothetical protein
VYVLEKLNELILPAFKAKNKMAKKPMATNNPTQKSNTVFFIFGPLCLN